MKRIYYLLATMAVLLMAGCANEDIMDPDNPEAKGALVFSAGISGGVKSVQTKADALALTGENVIKNLTVLLFDGTTGTYKYGKRVADEAGVDFVGDLEVSPGIYDIILIANSVINYTSDTDKPATLSDLNNKVDDVTTQTQTSLLMVSKLHQDVELDYIALDGGGYERRTYCYMFQEGDVASYNATQHTSQTALDAVYTGANEPVVMTRLASRIQLESVAFNGTANLEGATFKLTDVYLVNARPTTLLVPNAAGSYEAGTTYYRGAPATFTILDGMIHPKAAVKTYYAKTYANVTITDGGAANSFTSGTDMFQTYAFENHTAWVYDLEKTVYDARLVIAGVITLKDGQVQPPSYYHVPIKGADFQLTRNNVYGINVSITSYGYNNPDGRIGGGDDDPGDDNAKIDVKIEVNPWNVINQYEEDEF
ncbi:MAG: hypothetical protein LBV32_00370 [Tannerellaceae bacterium]|jgi:hypothetical protein|nr:hypothetical protein [Tannerellaceae bacterium]